MKRNDFVTNVLKCNNFHCLASLRLVDLNSFNGLPLLHLYQSSLPEASGFKQRLHSCYDWRTIGLASLRLVDLNRLPCHNYHCHIRLASLRLVDLNIQICVIVSIIFGLASLRLVDLNYFQQSYRYLNNLSLASLRLDILSLDKKSKALLLMLYFIKSYLFFIYGMTLVNH